MGTSYDFKCKQCGYTTNVCDGKDCGMQAVVETRVCNECQSVSDVLIGSYGKEGPTGDEDTDREIGICPLCESSDTHRWPRSHPCPKCGGTMKKGNTISMWD